MAGDVNAAVERAAAALATDDIVGAMAEQVSGADLTSFLLEVMRRARLAPHDCHRARRVAALVRGDRTRAGRSARYPFDPGDRAVRLAAVQRVLRSQPFGAVGQQHFTVLGIVTAGRDRGGLAFERAALGEQLGVLVTATRAVTAFPIRIAITNLRDAYTAALVGDVRAAIADAEVTVHPDRVSGPGYYQDLCFKIFVDGPSGTIEVGDGGFTDWTRSLIGNQKERLLIGGLGIDRLTDLGAG